MQLFSICLCASEFTNWPDGIIEEMEFLTNILSALWWKKLESGSRSEASKWSQTSAGLVVVLGSITTTAVFKAFYPSFRKFIMSWLINIHCRK